MAKYLVDGTLNHDGVTYEHGSAFETDDEKLALALRKASALKLPSEVRSAEDTQAELERLRAQVAALEASRLSDASGSDSGSDGEPPKSDSGDEQEQQA